MTTHDGVRALANGEFASVVGSSAASDESGCVKLKFPLRRDLRLDVKELIGWKPTEVSNSTENIGQHRLVSLV